MATIEITKDNFDMTVRNSAKPVLVDFWADWCGPCRMLSPVIDEISEERDDVVFGKLNVDDQPDLAVEFGVMSIPTLIIFKNGEIAGQSVGVQPKDALEDFIDNSIGK